MVNEAISHPKVAPREEWLAARLTLLQHEKQLTKLRDQVNAERRRLPMVKIDKNYSFEGPQGRLHLIELFQDRPQLIVYHFMFDPEWDAGCPGCTGFVDSLGDLSLLGERDTTFALVSRASVAKLETYKAQRGWKVPWYSSYGGDFNYDFHATHDPARGPVEYNFVGLEELEARRGGPGTVKGEDHGLSVFFQVSGGAFHTYSTYARGVEGLTDSYSLLDTTPYGRQEDFEDSPAGRPQRPTYG